MNKRAQCKVCGKPTVINTDGTLRHHTDHTKPKQATIWAPRCAGAGEPT